MKVLHKLISHNALAIAAAAFLAVTQAQAINNGSSDVNNDLPSVGAIVFMHPFAPIPLELCSGTLIHERGFLTAGHCTDAMEGLIATGLFELSDFYVSFSPDNALDTNTWLTVSGLFTDPGYYEPYTGGDSHDVGILELAVPVGDIEPAALAPVGFLDDLQTAGMLSRADRTEFIVAGYGLQRQFPEREMVDAQGVRTWAVSEFQALRKHTLQLNMVQAPGIDNGGTCFGDSGGPGFYFLDDGTALVTSVTSWGDNECVATDMRYRIDTAGARAFIDLVLNLIDNP